MLAALESGGPQRLVGRKSDRSLGRVEIESDHIGDVGEEAHPGRAARRNDPPSGTDAVNGPDPLDGRLTDARFPRERTRRETRALAEPFVQGSADDPLHRRFRDGGRATRPGGIPSEAGGSVEQEAPTPPSYRSGVGRKIRGNPPVGPSFGGAQHDPGPEPYLLRSGGVLGQRCKLSTFSPVQLDGRGTPHGFSREKQADKIVY